MSTSEAPNKTIKVIGESRQKTLLAYEAYRDNLYLQVSKVQGMGVSWFTLTGDSTRIDGIVLAFADMKGIKVEMLKAPLDIPMRGQPVTNPRVAAMPAPEASPPPPA